jgi:CubicO group peptidase (beta-lactamase class C family)
MGRRPRAWAWALALALAGASCAGEDAAEGEPADSDRAPATSATAETSGASGARGAAGAIDERLADGGSCAVAVLEGGELVHRSSVPPPGVVEGRPPGTRLRTTAPTTSLTAAAVLALAERGVLALDEPARTWLPELPAAWGEITVSHLLGGSSGIPDFRPLLPAGGAPQGVGGADVLAVLSAEPALDFVPGSQRRPAASEAVLLGLVAERSTGQPLSEVVAQLVLSPADLDLALVAEGPPGLQVVDADVESLARWADEWRTGATLGAVARELATGVVSERDGTDRPLRRASAADAETAAALATWPDDELSVALTCWLADPAPGDEALVMVDELVEDVAHLWLDA